MTKLPRPGYTLPVFACASAIAALRHLRDPQDVPREVLLDLVIPSASATLPIEQIARLPDGAVLAISRSDPGDNLDLTRHTPVWAVVAWGAPGQTEPLAIAGGEGIGRRQDDTAAIYRYAHQVLHHNLMPLIPPGKTLQVTVILPEGRALAQRTSNEAFGVVEGLSLLGTGGVSQPLSAPEQLEIFREALRQKATQASVLVFCVGENGLDRAAQMGVPPAYLVKTANWLGPLLVEAALQGVSGIVLFGYHGKLIKLAGGIFHTHHHVADGRQEILAAHAGAAGLPPAGVQTLLTAATAEAGLAYLRELGEDWVERIYGAIADCIDNRSQDYIFTHTERRITVGSVLFDRHRQIVVKSSQGDDLFRQILIS